MTFAHSAEVTDLKRRVEELEAENAALRVKLDLFREATCANCGAGPSTPGKEQKG